MRRIWILLTILFLSIPQMAVISQPTYDIENEITNQTPSMSSFQVYTDTGLVFDATILDTNGGADLDHVRIDVHETDNPSSDIICWFETPTNLTLTIGGTYLQYGIIFKRLTPTEAQLIQTGQHLYGINATDDDGSYVTDTALHYMYGEPHYINLNAQATSYIHRSDNNPSPDQVVQFTTYIVDFNTPKNQINATFYWSKNGKVTWYSIKMVYDGALENWNMNLGPYPQRTEVYYYIVATDGAETNRTPDTYDFLVWDVDQITGKFFLVLYQGWNLVSININCDMTANDLVLNPYVTVVVRKHPTTKLWETVIPYGDINYALDYEWGYYVYALRTVQVQLTGTAAGEVSLNLSQGWNLYGVSSNTNTMFLTSTTSITVIVRRNYYGLYTSYIKGLEIEDFVLTIESAYFLYATGSEEWYP